MSPRATSTYFSNASRDGNSIPSLGGLFQCLVASTTRLGWPGQLIVPIQGPGTVLPTWEWGFPQHLIQPMLGVTYSPTCDSPFALQTRSMAASPHYCSWLRALPEESQRCSDKGPAQFGAAKPSNLQGRQINRKVISMPGQPSEQTFPRSHHKDWLAEQALQSLDIEPREGGEDKKKRRKKNHTNPLNSFKTQSAACLWEAAKSAG